MTTPTPRTEPDTPAPGDSDYHERDESPSIVALRVISQSDGVRRDLAAFDDDGALYVVNAADLLREMEDLTTRFTRAEQQAAEAEARKDAVLVESLPAMLDEATAARVILYGRPDTLDLTTIDAPIREAVRRINASGWVFTAESCSGHPDATSKHVWGWNKPYLRLTTRRANMPFALDLLSRAASSFVDDEGLTSTFGLQVFRYDDRGDFAQVGVYLDARTVWERDAAMRVFEAFGDAAIDAARAGEGGAH